MCWCKKEEACGRLRLLLKWLQTSGSQRNEQGQQAGPPDLSMPSRHQRSQDCTSAGAAIQGRSYRQQAGSTHAGSRQAGRLAGRHLAEALCCLVEVCVDGAHIAGQQAAASATNVDTLQAVELREGREGGHGYGHMGVAKRGGRTAFEAG